MQIPPFLSHIPLDWIILGVFAIIVTFDALRYGPVRAASVSLSFPLAVLLFGRLYQSAFIGPLLKQYSSPTEQAALFFVLFVVLFLLVYRMTHGYGPPGGLTGALMSGLSATVVVLAMWIQTPALQSIWNFDPQIQMIFGTPYTLLWLLAAYLALAFARG